MAESEPKPPTETPATTSISSTDTPVSTSVAQTETPVNDEQKELKYLDFAQVAVIYVIFCLSTLYEYAKENSGPLKPGVQAVEGTVKTVIGPVYEKFHDVPFELLKYIDHKVDRSINEVQSHVPSLVKQVSSQAIVAAHSAPEVARSVASEVQSDGLVETASHIAKTLYTKYEPTAKELYTKYEPVAEEYAVLAWRALYKLPLFPQVAEILVPTAAYWSEKYNQVVMAAADRGYTVSYYMPLVPVERISKVFEGDSSVSNGEPLLVEQ